MNMINEKITNYLRTLIEKVRFFVQMFKKKFDHDNEKN